MDQLEQRFEQTLKEQKDTIFTVCYMFSKDEDEVNDLFQEVLINLWNGFEGFEHRSDIRSWVYRVALNTCISYDRKRRRTDAERLNMNINLFEDRDEDTRQVDMLHKRISKLQPFPCYCPALAGEPLLRGDRPDSGYHHQECQCTSVQNPRAVKEYVKRLTLAHYEQ